MRFRSADGGFGLHIPIGDYEGMVARCRGAGRAETGGIVAGRYNEQHDCAMVTEVTGPPEDSRSGRSWFRRGVRGLQHLMGRIWDRDRSFYLGEWHYHPYATPEPSRADAEQMTLIAGSSDYACPEPILIILGGDPVAGLDARAFVFRRGSDCVELLRPRHEAAGEQP